MGLVILHLDSFWVVHIFTIPTLSMFHGHHTGGKNNNVRTCLASKEFFSGVRILLISGPAPGSFLPK